MPQGRPLRHEPPHGQIVSVNAILRFGQVDLGPDTERVNVHACGHLFLVVDAIFPLDFGLPNPVDVTNAFHVRYGNDGLIGRFLQHGRTELLQSRWSHVGGCEFANLLQDLLVGTKATPKAIVVRYGGLFPLLSPALHPERPKAT
ncbi:MAG: hypothetical protein ISR77_31000 [Pirellulaceae bacterium]|nr:hypothetical protein [Pirellulaceae bacterium]